MSDIQIPDEVIEEAAKAEWNASESRTFDGPWDDQDDGTKDMWRRGPLVSAPIIAAWARTQALEDVDSAIAADLKKVSRRSISKKRYGYYQSLDIVGALLAETKETSA